MKQLASRDKGFSLVEILVVVAIIGILAAIAIPAYFAAIDKAKQSATMVKITTLGRRIQQYIIDFQQIGSPKVGTDIDELHLILNEIGFTDDDQILYDGWKGKLAFSSSAPMASRDFTITSYGSDFEPGPAPETPGTVHRFAEDLIYFNNYFTQKPEGKQSR